LYRPEHKPEKIILVIRKISSAGTGKSTNIPKSLELTEIFQITGKTDTINTCLNLSVNEYSLKNNKLKI